MDESGSNLTSGLRPLALAAVGSTGADIERLVREARQKARRERRALTWTDLEAALSASRTSMTPELRWRVAVHEAGHAIAWTVLDLAVVRTVALGIGGAGHVIADLREGDCHGEVWGQHVMTCLLAGRAAETLIFGDALSGSGGSDESDLAKATSYALDAETALGFSSVLPLLYRSERDRAPALTMDRQLAERVHARLEAAETAAVALLDENRTGLVAVARALNEVGVLEGAEVRQLLTASAGQET